jgi:quaternary ammonium compound-resistance protein SugE
MPWAYLLVAGLCEVGFTTCLKASDGLTKFWWALGFVVLLTASMGLLTLATRGPDGIEMGTAYAVWTGIGAAGTVVVQIIWFKDPVTAGRLVFLTLLIGSVIGLKLVSPEKDNDPAPAAKA